MSLLFIINNQKIVKPFSRAPFRPYCKRIFFRWGGFYKEIKLATRDMFYRAHAVVIFLYYVLRTPYRNINTKYAIFSTYHAELVFNNIFIFHNSPSIFCEDILINQSHKHNPVYFCMFLLNERKIHMYIISKQSIDIFRRPIYKSKL